MRTVLTVIVVVLVLLLLGFLGYRTYQSYQTTDTGNRRTTGAPTSVPEVRSAAATAVAATRPQSIEAPAPTPAPTAQPAPKPTAQPAQAPAPAASKSECLTTAQAQTAFGVSVQKLDTEPCAWVWRGKPSSAIATCPEGYVCTWDVKNDITVVHEGIGQKAEIFAGTWRLVGAYPAGDAVHDTCALYQKEKAFGAREVPSFEVRFQPVPNQGPQSCK